MDLAMDPEPGDAAEHRHALDLVLILGISYLLGSVVLGLAATTFGAWLSRSISGG